MESGRIEPLRARTSGGTALPPATPVGQIYTMYIDFPLDGNTLNPTVQSLKRVFHIFGVLPGACGGVLAPGCSKSASEGLEAPADEVPRGPWRPLEAPGGPCRVLSETHDAAQEDALNPKP